jgi:hypothetical protein
LQRTGDLVVITLELLQDLLSTLFRQLNQQAFRGFNVVRSNKKMGVVARYLNDEVTLTELFRPFVQHDSVFV